MRAVYSVAMHRPSPPQRQRLQFCKAFFEVSDASAAGDALVEGGAQLLVEAPDGDRWFAWTEPADSRAAARATFLLRMRGTRLVMEGPSPDAVGRGWRSLQPLLRPHAEPRVAAGDDLHRFVGRPRRLAADRPETWDRDYERRVLREFYAAFCARWASQPQERLQGMTPREAAAVPHMRPLLEELLARLARVQEEREQRGMPAIDVAALRAEVALGGEPR